MMTEQNRTSISKKRPASNPPELKKDLFIHHPKIVVQAGDNASEDPLLLPTL